MTIEKRGATRNAVEVPALWQWLVIAGMGAAFGVLLGWGAFQGLYQ